MLGVVEGEAGVLAVSFAMGMVTERVVDRRVYAFWR
jgi:hypothetical protein